MMSFAETLARATGLAGCGAPQTSMSQTHRENRGIKQARSGRGRPRRFWPASDRFRGRVCDIESVGAPQPASPVARASVSANDIINDRGYWQGLPSAETVDAPQVSASRVASAPAPRRAIASAAAARGHWPIGPIASRFRTLSPMRRSPLRSPSPARCRWAGNDAGRARRPTGNDNCRQAQRRPSLGAPPKVSVVRVGDRFNDPWMRAMIVSPSALEFHETTVYGVPDFRTLGPYLQKPASTMMATFSEDPHRGMTSESFAGSAVGFTRTVTFGPPRTASLR